MNTIYLVRHGENPANITREFSYKQIDYSLTPRGILQAQQTAAFFKDNPIDAIYCSPLKRALETAQIIGAVIGREPIIVEHFREVNVGALEMQEGNRENWAIHDTIVRGWLTGQPDVLFPAGENYHMLLERMRLGLAEALAGRDNQRVIIVAHGGLFTFTLKDICREIDLNAVIAKYGHNCSITEIEMHTRTGQLEGLLKSWAMADHLSGEAAMFAIGHMAYEEKEPA